MKKTHLGITYLFVCAVVALAGFLALSAVAAGPSRFTSTLEDEQTFELPEKYDEFAVGGGGQYYIFYTHKSNTLRVFDLAQLKMLGDIELPDRALVAAGREKLMIVLPGQKMVQRWDLATLEREKTVAIKSGPDLSQAVMGIDSDGPLLLWDKRAGAFFDIDKMQLFLPKGPMLSGHEKWGLHLAASADGQTFTGWIDSGSGGTCVALRLSGRNSTTTTGPSGIYGDSRYLPNANGSLILQNGGDVYDRFFNKASTTTLKDARLVPTEDPRYFIAWRAEGKQVKVDICTAGDRKVVYSCPEPITLEEKRFLENPRIRYLAGAKLLVSLPESNQEIVVRPLDWAAERKKSDEDYLIITSAPNTEASTGTTYSYQLEAESKAGSVSYSLESGPKGMKISPTGLVEWKVTGKPVGGGVQVIVQAKDKSGKQALQSFDIAVVQRTTQVVSSGKKRSAAGGVISKPEVPEKQPARPANGAKKKEQPKPDDSADATETEPAAATEELVVTDEIRLEVPKGPYSIRPGLGGRTLLVLLPGRLAIVGPDGHTIEKQVKLDKDYADIAERPGYYVAVANKPQSINLIDKQTLKVIKTKLISFVEARHLTLHPTLPVTYISFKAGFDPPRYKFIVYNEETNEGREGDNLIGNEMAVEPQGRWMVTSWDDIYKSGSRLIVNPNQAFTTPTYGSIDVLFRYELDDQGMPKLADRKEKAGGNGRGLRMSSDGKRVTYLSVVGYPEHSGNLAGWDPLDFKKMPITYATKDVGSASDLAYHPVLPLVASPGSGAAVFFDRETGEVQENRLQDSQDALAGAKPERVYFSPDGRSLILDGTVNDIHYLHRLPLTLSAAEQKLVAGMQFASPEVQPGVKPEAKGNEFRLWTDTLQRTVKARFAGLAEEKVRLVKEDGKELLVPLAKLSEADQQYAKQQAAVRARAQSEERLQRTE